MPVVGQHYFASDSPLYTRKNFRAVIFVFEHSQHTTNPAVKSLGAPPRRGARTVA